jgi:DNA polymerase-3 subunit epsilon
MPFDGETYDCNLDKERLSSQLERTKDIMFDGNWRTLSELRIAIEKVFDKHDTEAALSARLRDLRKDKFGAHKVVSRRRKEFSGLWEYKVESNEEEEMTQRLNRIIAPGFLPTADWTKLPLAVIDFETTGLDPMVDRIIEYGVALFKNGEYSMSFGGLVNPEVPLSEEAARVNGITDEELQKAPVFADVFPTIEAGLKDFVPVAYNAEFDRDFLHNEVSRVNRHKVLVYLKDLDDLDDLMINVEMIKQIIDTEPQPAAFYPDVEWIDPLVWIRKIYKYQKGSKKLTDVCKFLNIEFDNAHRAVSDARAAGEVLMAIADKIRIADYHTLIHVQKCEAVTQQREFARWKEKQNG